MAEILSFESEQAWLEARRKYVTSTEVSALFGASPRLTAFELAVIKSDPKLDSFEGNERTEWGQALQDAIAARIAMRDGALLESLAYKIAVTGATAASGDYRIVAPGALRESRLNEYFHRLGTGMLEIKNVDWLVFKNEWTEEEMPDHIEIQLQAEMLCWDTKWGAVGALVGGNRLQLYVRERDTEVCRLITEKSRSFMTNLAKGVLPQATMPQDAHMLIALHQYADPGKVFNADGVGALETYCRAYRSAKEEEKAAKEVAESFKAQIFELIKDAESVIGLEGFNLSAKMRAPVKVAAHTRAGFRDLRITEKKVNNGKK